MTTWQRMTDRWWLYLIGFVIGWNISGCKPPVVSKDINDQPYWNSNSPYPRAITSNAVEIAVSHRVYATADYSIDVVLIEGAEYVIVHHHKLPGFAICPKAVGIRGFMVPN